MFACLGRKTYDAVFKLNGLPVLSFYRISRRQASLTSAISRGIRRSQQDATSFQDTRERNSRPQIWQDGERSAKPKQRDRSHEYIHRTPQNTLSHHIRPSVERDFRQEHSITPETSKIDFDRQKRLSKGDPGLVTSIPYTTPASEFLYGRFAVEAALRARRRKLYTLYILQKENGSENEQDAMILDLAAAAGVQVNQVGSESTSMLNKMSDFRPHNGFVLEASPLPKLPIRSLTEMTTSDKFSFYLDYQSEEEKAINGSEPQLPNHTPNRGHPLVLMLDRILDPGNLGAIIRSAAFLGVSAVLLIHHGTAPLSAVALKASAGAAENMPVLITKNSVQFMKDSKKCGWRFYAAASPDSSNYASKSESSLSSTVLTALENYPSVLILGEEQSGVQQRHQKLADFVVGIDRAGPANFGLESLNVSVAAALLCDRFMNGHKQLRSSRHTKESQRFF
ncbi:MAG: hypothetical protein Q9227_003376 [Pyrenula ochraceoflavens]